MEKIEKRKIPCWQCGKPLTYVRHELNFVLVTVGTTRVRVHKICRADAVAALETSSRPEPEEGRTQATRMSDEVGT